MGLPSWPVGKESACNVGDLGSISELWRSPGHGNPLQYSCLENPHGQRSLVGYSLWGLKELDMTWVTKHSTAQNGIISISYVFLNSDQIRSVAQLCPTLCDPMNRSTPGLPVHLQLPEFTETHDHRVSDAIQPSHPLSSPSPLAPNSSQHQSLFQWVNSSHEVAQYLIIKTL